MREFKLVSDFEPAGDQPGAIEKLVEGLERGDRHQVLLGVTGSGKTFTIANVIERTRRAALVVAHNKTLAGQLYSEFCSFFPRNAVCFFVSYYDYYQPEAYIPQTDTYIEKDAAINDEIDRLRHVATHALVTRRDVVIVASVSCIFGLGPVENYDEMRVDIVRGENLGRDRLLRRLVEIQYSRNDLDFRRGTFRVRGDVVDIFPVYEEERGLRISFWGDQVEEIHLLDSLRGVRLDALDEVSVFPGSHYVTAREGLHRAVKGIREELAERLQQLRAENRLLEAQRLEQRTLYDVEMLEQTGWCPGIENYSRHLSGRLPGEPPPTLIDYLPADALVVIDESHQTLPQLKAMVRGDRSRKQTLVDHGFRLPSALDNRPLSFEEFDSRVGQRIYVSATPAEYEIGAAGGVVVEQINRPTGLVDPEVEIRPAAGQVEDVLGELRRVAARGQRALVTTLTKRMAEELCDYLADHGVRVRYLHADVETLERLELVRDLRRGVFDVLVGINLLREGLDIPEVSLVAVLDADREGFLRSQTSLVQTAGRAARHLEGKVIFYADQVTGALQAAVRETDRRRQIQQRFNRRQKIVPRSVIKEIRELPLAAPPQQQVEPPPEVLGDEKAFLEQLQGLERRMRQAADALEFEKAAELRDAMRRLKAWRLKVG